MLSFVPNTRKRPVSDIEVCDDSQNKNADAEYFSRARKRAHKIQNDQNRTTNPQHQQQPQAIPTTTITTMCLVSNNRPIVTNNVIVLNKLAPKKQEHATTQEYGSYGDYWGCDELTLPPQPSLGTSTSCRSLKSVEFCAGYGSFWGLDQE